MSDISGWGVKGWNMEAVSFIVAWFVSRSGFVCHFRNLVFVYKVTPKETITPESLQVVYGVQSKVTWTEDQQAMIHYL